MIEINLIPDVKRELLKAQRTRSAVVTAAIFASIISVGVVVLLLVYVYGVQLGRGAILNSQISNKSAELAQVEDLSRMVTIQNQLGKISELNNEKNMSSRLFDMLSAVLPPEPNTVRVSQLDVNSEEGTVRIEGQTRGFDSMEVFKKTLASAVITVPASEGESTPEAVPLATDIGTSDISYGEDATGNKVLRFVLSFTYAKELFDSKVDTVTIKRSINGNVTDSFLGLPKSIFTERAKDLKENE